VPLGISGKEYEAIFAADARKALLYEWITNRRLRTLTELRAQAPILKPGFLSRFTYQDVVEVITDEHFSVAPYRDAGSQDFILGMTRTWDTNEGRALLNR